jgi:hypothetical protein
MATTGDTMKDGQKVTIRRRTYTVAKVRSTTVDGLTLAVIDLRGARGAAYHLEQHKGGQWWLMPLGGMSVKTTWLDASEIEGLR